MKIIVKLSDGVAKFGFPDDYTITLNQDETTVSSLDGEMVHRILDLNISNAIVYEQVELPEGEVVLIGDKFLCHQGVLVSNPAYVSPEVSA
jgi:hypothetical protein